jgi:hypothetical protein
VLAGEKTLALVSKHIVDNIVTLRFLGITTISDASAESLLEAIDSFILQKELPANKLFHLRSDETSNMTGFYLTFIILFY